MGPKGIEDSRKQPPIQVQECVRRRSLEGVTPGVTRGVTGGREGVLEELPQELPEELPEEEKEFWRSYPRI